MEGEDIVGIIMAVLFTFSILLLIAGGIDASIKNYDSQVDPNVGKVITINVTEKSMTFNKTFPYTINNGDWNIDCTKTQYLYALDINQKYHAEINKKYIRLGNYISGVYYLKILDKADPLEIPSSKSQAISEYNNIFLNTDDTIPQIIIKKVLNFYTGGN